MKGSLECLVNGTVAADCNELPPDAFWWLTFAAGLFEHLTADVAFPDIVEDTVPLVFPDVDYSTRQELVAWVSNGSLARSFLDGNWELMPGVPHPRGLTGCDYLASNEVRTLLNIDLCSAEEYSSIRFMCPVSCGCSVGKVYHSFVSPEGDVSFELDEELHMVSNRMEDLGSCPAACVMVHPGISGDSSYDSIGEEYFEVSGEEYCESGLLSAEECDRSTCCQLDSEGPENMCWSAIGASTCYDTAFAAGGNQSGSFFDPYDGCTDTDVGPPLAKDSLGDTCNDYASEQWECDDEFDDKDFTVADMCCWCGGGKLD